MHTGQHYDANMSKVFFDDLELPHPDVYLGIGSGSHAVQTAKIMVEFEKIVLAEKPDMVIVVGDVNSTVACSLVCSKLLIPVGSCGSGASQLRPHDAGRDQSHYYGFDCGSSFLFRKEAD